MTKSSITTSYLATLIAIVAIVMLYVSTPLGSSHFAFGF